jgi:hypothetical protein
MNMNERNERRKNLMFILFIRVYTWPKLYFSGRIIRFLYWTMLPALCCCSAK